jgi:glycosyltransferase involved in cell wall biosynthesis
MSFPVDRPPRVLMFAPAFAPSFFSEALVNSKLALAMLDAGWEVVVFAAPGGGKVYSSGWGEPWSRLEAVRRDPPDHQRSGLAGNAARLLGAIRTGHPIGSASWADRAARAALELHREQPFDLALSRSTSCIAHLPAMLFRRRLGDAAPVWIANWNDPPSHRFPPPYCYPVPPLQRLLKDRYLRAAATTADVNTFPSEQLRDYLAEPLGLDTADTPMLRRGLIIPHIGMGWRPGSAAAPADPSRFRICHAGNLSRERDPTLLFKAFAKVAKRYPEIRCEIEIIGQLDPAFEAVAAEFGLTGVIRKITGMPFLDCLERLAEADLLVLIEAPCERGVFLPSKLIDYVEVGRPLLALSPSVGAVRDLIECHEFGWFAANDSEDEIEAALERSLDERYRQEAARARQDARERMADRVRPDRIIQDIWQAAEQASERV